MKNNNGNQFSDATKALMSKDLIAINKIYSQKEMCDLYGVSRATLQRAIRRQRNGEKLKEIDDITQEKLESFKSVGAWTRLKQTSTYKDVMNKS